MPRDEPQQFVSRLYPPRQRSKSTKPAADRVPDPTALQRPDLTDRDVAAAYLGVATSLEGLQARVAVVLAANNLGTEDPDQFSYPWFWNQVMFGQNDLAGKLIRSLDENLNRRQPSDQSNQADQSRQPPSTRSHHKRSKRPRRAQPKRS